MRIRIFTTFIFVAALAVLLGGCGDGSADGELELVAAEIPDPCSLVDKQRIEAIMGEPVAEPVRSEGEASKSCTYTSAAQPPRMAEMKITSPCSMFDFSSQVGDGDEAVGGLGMHAYWNRISLLVHTSAGDACLIVSGGGNPRGGDPEDDRPALENAKQVAQTMLEKMES